MTFNGDVKAVSSEVVSNKLRDFGWFAYTITTAIDVRNSFYNPEKQPWGKTVFNAAIYGIANKLGGWGLGISVVYTVLDKTGFIQGPLPTIPMSNGPCIAIPDDTRVANPLIH